MRTSLLQVFFVINLLVYGGFAVAGYAIPGSLANWVEIQLPTPMALADFRAMYGGLSLAFAVAIVRAMREESWIRPALWMIAASCLGLAGGRVITWIGTGELSPLMAKVLASELLGLGFAVGFIAKRRVG
jgi:hypothetical protein